MKLLEIVHPAAKTLADISLSQDAEVHVPFSYLGHLSASVVGYGLRSLQGHLLTFEHVPPKHKVELSSCAINIMYWLDIVSSLHARSEITPGLISGC